MKKGMFMPVAKVWMDIKNGKLKRKGKGYTNSKMLKLTSFCRCSMMGIITI